MKTSEKIWWTKLVLALVTAFITFSIQTFLNVEGLMSFIIGLLIYFIISDLLSNMNKIERFRGLKIGAGVYFFTWILTWVAIHTFAVVNQ
jgi:hypothetical protein